MEKGTTYAYVFLTCIVGIVFWIALAASVDMDYAVARVTFADAAAKAVHMPVSTVFHDAYVHDYLRFLASIGLAVATLFLPRPSFRIGAVVIALLVSLSAGYWCAPILAFVFPFYIFTGSDGETWGEAWPAISAIGFWVVVSIGYIVFQWVYYRKGKIIGPNQTSHRIARH